MTDTVVMLHPAHLLTAAYYSSLFPVFFDQPADLLWNSTTEPCDQPPLEDYTGVDSLAAFGISIVTFVAVQALEHYCGGPLFHFTGLTPYEKEFRKHCEVDDTKHTQDTAIPPEIEEDEPDDASA